MRGRSRRGGRSAALGRIQELREAAAAERRRERELGRERETALAERDQARELLVVALAEGRDGAEERRALEEAEARASVRWDEIAEAAKRRVRAADAAIDLDIAGHFAEIKAEKMALDQAAHERFRAAVEEIDEAIGAMEAESGAWSALLVAAEGIPSSPRHAVMGLERLAHEVRRVRMSGVPAPTPPDLVTQDNNDSTLGEVA
ncbi:MAG: hypothetical protein WKF33_07700 [Thermoleophilaceae bacterium]